MTVTLEFDLTGIQMNPSDDIVALLGCEYTSAKTVGDGACAVHALFGHPDISGAPRCPDARIYAASFFDSDPLFFEKQATELHRIRICCTIIMGGNWICRRLGENPASMTFTYLWNPNTFGKGLTRTCAHKQFNLQRWMHILSSIGSTFAPNWCWLASSFSVMNSKQC